MKFKLIKVDGTCTCMLNGHMYVSDTLTSENEMKLVSFGTDVTEEQASQIIEIFNPKLQEIRESNREVQGLVNVLLDSGLFEERDGAYYRVGNPISVPKMLLERYKSLMTNPDLGNEEYDNQLQALDNFWLKCSLNPNKEARENLFQFLNTWGFTITTTGYIVGYRNVKVKQEGNKELHDFIATNYTKIKGQKKSPKNYIVCQQLGDYKLCTSDNIPKEDNPYWVNLGNLHDLYNDLASLSGTVYTDEYTGKMTITIGDVVSIPRKDCDESQRECSRGLHIGGTSWLTKGYFGEVGLVCLVNPMHVVSCPNAGIYGKMRCSEYLPIGVAEYDEEGKIIPVATDIYEDDYEKYTIDELNKLLKEIDSSNQVIHQLTFKEVPNQVYKTMDDYRLVLESKNETIWTEDDDDGDYEDDDDYCYGYLDEDDE